MFASIVRAASIGRSSRMIRMRSTWDILNVTNVVFEGKGPLICGSFVIKEVDIAFFDELHRIEDTPGAKIDVSWRVGNEPPNGITFRCTDPIL